MQDMKEQMLGKLKSLIVDVGKIDDVKDVVTRALKLDVNPLDLVNALSEALLGVGSRYESGEYFLSELLMAGNLSTYVVDILKPYLVKTGRTTRGKVVIGTVKGDVHDIGKNILIMMLNASGFQVVDLGVDVPNEEFARAVDREQPEILGMSALLSSTMYEMQNVIRYLDEKGLRKKLKVIVGGRPLTKEFAQEIGADGFAEDAISAVKLVEELIVKGKEN